MYGCRPVFSSGVQAGFGNSTGEKQLCYGMRCGLLAGMSFMQVAYENS